MLIDFSRLYFFIPIFFIISITPGLCMTLALTMGIAIGVRNTMKMMLGELIGVLIVAGISVVGGGAIVSSFPMAFLFLKYGGGLYLMVVGYQMINSRGSLALNFDGANVYEISFIKLSLQGFITAVANPKGWAFFIAIVPAFINYEISLFPQMSALVFIILVIEFLSLMLYASGGQALGVLLKRRNNFRVINRIAGILMICVGIWLGLS
ncbi:MAG: LysE family translocator [Rhodospirillales bacterium]